MRIISSFHFFFQGASKSSSIRAEAEAEELGSTAMKEARLQEVELERLEILNQMATVSCVFPKIVVLVSTINYIYTRHCSYIYSTISLEYSFSTFFGNTCS